MRELFRQLRKILEDHRPAVLVTVVASSGSVPRGAGAWMLVSENGRVCGTIGGGAVEHRAELDAEKALKSGQSVLEQYILAENDVLDLGMVCGGSVRVYFACMDPADPEALSVCREAEAMFQKKERSWLLLDTDKNSGCPFRVYGTRSGLTGGKVPGPVLALLEGEKKSGYAENWYFERLVSPGYLYIFGGGHVSQALVPAAAKVGFACVVLEDRPEFVKKELFPDAVRTILMGDFGHINEYIQITEDDYLCIMTRGHKDDMIVEAQALGTPAGYIGVIGSRRKTAYVNARLRELGWTDEDLRRVTTPIGLDIRAETPEEIAVSITAQLILERAAGIRE